MADWLVRQPGSEPIGPVSTELVVRGLQAGRVVPSALLCRVGTQEWRLLSEFPEFAGFVFDDAATNVTDSPWFADRAPSGRPPAPPARPPALSGLGLPAAPPTLGSRGVLPPPATRPLVAGQRAYDDVDDDAETRVAAPPSEATEFPVDDETMTRVAGGNLRAPPAPAPPGAGVLPTLPMPEAPDFQATRADVPKPRPAAGAPASQPREDGLPPTQPFVQAGAFPPPPGQPPAPYQGAYGYSAPPAPYPQGNVPPPYGQYPPPQPYPPETGSDQGLKALVGLIVFLAVALAIVLILLVIRR